MIYTVTFNPSLDYVLELDRFEAGEVNRAGREALRPGGKGINVSIILSRLGVPNLCLGFTAGFTGTAFEQMVQDTGCRTDFIRLPLGNTRINVKLKAQVESEINGRGPAVPAAALEELLHKLDALDENDILVLAGSIPPALPKDMYEHILARLEGRNIRFTVDATGELLKNVLPRRPFLVKPNLDELGEVFGAELHTPEDAMPYAHKMQAMGARNVLVSMAGQGALLLDEEGHTHHSLPPEGKVVDSVGAGDSMVAGFLAGWLKTGRYDKALQLGLAAGSATAFHEWLGQPDEMAALLDNPAEFGL